MICNINVYNKLTLYFGLLVVIYCVDGQKKTASISYVFMIVDYIISYLHFGEMLLFSLYFLSSIGRACRRNR